jgi:hypothetical protein
MRFYGREDPKYRFLHPSCACFLSVSQVDQLTAENQHLRQLLSSVQQSGGVLQHAIPFELPDRHACEAMSRVELEDREVGARLVSEGAH